MGNCVGSNNLEENVFKVRNINDSRDLVQKGLMADDATLPFAFEPSHAAELGPLASRARMIDGEMVSWHGVRMEAAMGYLAEQAVAAR